MINHKTTNTHTNTNAIPNKRSAIKKSTKQNRNERAEHFLNINLKFECEKYYEPRANGQLTSAERCRQFPIRTLAHFIFIFVVIVVCHQMCVHHLKLSGAEFKKELEFVSKNDNQAAAAASQF